MIALVKEKSTDMSMQFSTVKNNKFLMKICDNGSRDIQQIKNWKLKNQNFNQRISLNRVFYSKRTFHS